MRTCLKLVMIALIAMLLIIGGTAIWLYRSIEPERVDIQAADRPADRRLLFIGNSFTYANDLDQMVAHLVAETDPIHPDVLAIRVAPGGYRLVDHAHDLQNVAGNPPIRQVLITGSATLRDWDLIVIQGQSQIMGFSSDWYNKVELLQVAPVLADAARATGATTMLFMTWGYAAGDHTHQDIYPDYPTMQTRLQQGYDHLAGILSGDGQGGVFVAPVGLGFRAVYEDEIRSGRDPLASTSWFRQLYAGDAYHPSVAGSYLAACVITAAYTGHSATLLTWTPDGLDRAYAAYLRTAADQIVLDSRYGPRVYPPWNEH